MQSATPITAAVRERGFWGLFSIGLVFFHRPLLLGETFFFRDLYTFYLPQETRLIRFLKSGEAPFWDPYLHGGVPFLADISGSPFYPLNALGLLLAPTAALSLGIVAHFLAAAAATYVLARTLGARQPAAFIAGAVYAYCGFTLSQGNFLHRIQAMPYVPLLILFWHLFLVDGRRRWFLLAVACGAMQVLAGAPTVIAPCLVLALGWGLVQVPATRRSLLQCAAAWTVLAVSVGGLTAFQLVPTSELASQSVRGFGMTYSTFSFWSLHLLRLPELVLPEFLGPIDTLSNASYWGAALVDQGFPYFLSLYTGAIVLVLALVGAVERGLPERRLRLCLAGFAVVALVLALGRNLPFFELLYRFVPGIRLFRFPVKFLAFGTLPLALLAAYGAGVVFAGGSRGSKRWKRTVAAAWLVLGAPAAALLVAAWVPSWSTGLQVRLFGSSSSEAAAGLFASARHALAFALLATLVGYLLIRSLRMGNGETRRGRPAVLAWAFAAVVAADLMVAGRSLNPTVAAEVIESVPAAARLVAGEVGDGRLFRGPSPPDFTLDMPSDDVVWHYRWNQEVLNFYLAAAYDIPVIFHSDFNGFAPGRTLHLANAVAELSWPESRPILAAGSVTVVMTHDEMPELERIATVPNASRIPVHVYRNADAARRLEWIGVWHTAASIREAVRAVLAPGFDPRRHAVLEAPIEPRGRAACESAARVELVEAHSSRRLYRVSAPCDGILVFSETFFPGCEVRIDGRRAPIWRANVAFMAAPVGAGEHEVEWRYVPRSFYRGLAISGVTLLGLFALCRLPRGRRDLLS